MSERPSVPGVSREERLSEEGLMRLERQLLQGAPMNRAVLAQWIRRYGEPARTILKKHGHYSVDLENVA